MSAFTYTVGYARQRNRLTVAFRAILAIPHLIVAQVWGYLAQILGLVQWFIILFTGQRNQGIFEMQRSWLNYYGRVLGYYGLLYDPYPAFGTETGNAPVHSDIQYETPANRLTSGLRFLWVIPAALLAAVIGIAAFAVGVVSWFAIVITGEHPKGMWEFLQQAVRYTLQVQSYALLMTDDYPKWGTTATTTFGAAAPGAV